MGKKETFLDEADMLLILPERFWIAASFEHTSMKLNVKRYRRMFMKNQSSVP